MELSPKFRGRKGKKKQDKELDSPGNSPRLGKNREKVKFPALKSPELPVLSLNKAGEFPIFRAALPALSLARIPAYPNKIPGVCRRPRAFFGVFSGFWDGRELFPPRVSHRTGRGIGFPWHRQTAPSPPRSPRSFVLFGEF